jgi:hypothetical protein
MTKKKAYIFSIYLSKYLLHKGFVLLESDNKVLFAFNETPELIEAIKQWMREYSR